MRTKTVKELKEILDNLNDDDFLVIETIDLETGDTLDLYPMYVDVIEIEDGKNEVRMCQMTQNHFEK